jgi:lysophospholipase L1-like esterase
VSRLAPALALALCLLLAACSAPPSPPPAAGARTIVTLGDSVPAGTGCDCDPFPDLYAGLLAPPARSIDDARPGYTSADVRGQVAGAEVRTALAGATVVLIMAGANDLAGVFDGSRAEPDYRDAAAGVRRNVGAVVAAVRELDPAVAVVLVLGYWNVVKGGAVGLATYGVDGERSAVTATRYVNEALRQAADDSGARYLPTAPAFPDDPTALLSPDGDHPNAAGHEAIAAALFAAWPYG